MKPKSAAGEVAEAIGCAVVIVVAIVAYVILRQGGLI